MNPVTLFIEIIEFAVIIIIEKLKPFPHCILQADILSLDKIQRRYNSPYKYIYLQPVFYVTMLMLFHCAQREEQKLIEPFNLSFNKIFI